MRIQRKHLFMALGAVATGVAVWAMMRPEPIDVDVAVVAKGRVRETIDERGLTRLRHHTEVAAPVTGRVAESRLKVGDSVRAGDVVAVMVPAPLDPRTREQAEMSVASAKSARDEATARVEQARLALADAHRARTRAEQLARTGALADRDLEQAVDAEKLRERDLVAANAREAVARRDQERARLALLPTDPTTPNAARITVRAPMTGRVLRLFEEHDRVLPAGTSLVEIGDPASLEVVVDVLSQDAVRIRPGAPIELRITRDSAVGGRVDRVEPAAFTKVSPLGIEEQRVHVIATPSRPLVAGDRFEVEASIVVWERENVVRVPLAALVPYGEEWGVWVAKGGRVQLRAVSVGRRGNDVIEVTRGVALGDSIVVHPDERLVEGARVRR